MTLRRRSLALLAVSVLLMVLLPGCLIEHRAAPPPSRQPWMYDDIRPEDYEQLWKAEGGAALPPAPPAQPSGNVMVVVESLVHTEGQDDLAAVAWRLRSGSLTVGSSPVAQRNGIAIAVGGQDFAARLQAARANRRSAESARQSITVLSGHEGSFFVGQELPVTRLVYWTPNGRVALIESATVGRSLIVRPTILPDGQIDLEITPQFSSVGPAARSIRLHELSSRVVVRHGQPLLLGALHESGTDLGATLFAFSARRRDRTLTYIVTPYIL